MSTVDGHERGAIHARGSDRTMSRRETYLMVARARDGMPRRCETLRRRIAKSSDTDPGPAVVRDSGLERPGLDVQRVDRG